MSRRKTKGNTHEDDESEEEDVPITEEEEEDNEEEDSDEEEKPKKKPIKKKPTKKEEDSESEEEEVPKKKPTKKEEVGKKKNTKLVTPLRSNPTQSKKQGIYPFDKDFMKSYETLIEMLNDRGYILSQPGKESLFGYSEYVSVNNKGNTKTKKVIKITEDTRRALINEFGGLENFKLELSHPNHQLDILVYFIIPGIEAKSATQARKQLPIEQVRHALRAYEQSSIPRLILLSNVELASQGEELLRKANSQIMEDQPHRLVHFFSIDDLSFNWMKSRYQPKNIRVLRDDEQNAVLSSIEIDDNQEDKKFSLPYISDNDPLCVWYGAKVGDLIQQTRKSPYTTDFVRYVLPYETLTT